MQYFTHFTTTIPGDKGATLASLCPQRTLEKEGSKGAYKDRREQNRQNL